MMRIISQVLATILMSAAAVFAPVAPAALAQEDLLFGQNHYYTVIFRGNGEAVVYARFAITNPEDTPLTEFSFEVPRGAVTDLVIFQQKVSPPCLRYDYQKPDQPCLEYGEEQTYDFGASGYYPYREIRAEYQKATYTKTGNQYSFTLPTAVAPQKSTALIVAYAAFGYARESLGLLSFNFETLKVPRRIQRVRVAIDVDTDLYLKGKRAEVNYGTSVFRSTEVSAPTGLSNTALDQISASIGGTAPLTKEALRLAPNESFSVKGQYAKSWWRLYLREMMTTVLVIAAVLTGFTLWYRRWKRRHLTRTETPVAPAGTEAIHLLNPVFAGLGLLSAVLVIVLTYLLQFLSDWNLQRILGLNEPIGMMLFMVIMLLLYAFAVFGPAVLVGTKRGWKAGLVVVIDELLWLILLFIVYAILFQSGVTTPLPKPIPNIRY